MAINEIKTVTNLSRSFVCGTFSLQRSTNWGD